MVLEYSVEFGWVGGLVLLVDFIHLSKVISEWREREDRKESGLSRVCGEENIRRGS